MRYLVTGGAGFIGREICKKLLSMDDVVYAVDNLSNGKEQNIEEFVKDNKFHFVESDITDEPAVKDLYEIHPEVIINAAAQIAVGKSIEDPFPAKSINYDGTFLITNLAKMVNAKVVHIGTYVMYDLSAVDGTPIDEERPLKARNPYSASKIGAEAWVRSFYYSYGLPVVLLRLFNTYGPYQRTDMGEAVIAVYLKNKILGEDIFINGDGSQTRDFTYVEDTADCIVKASKEPKAVGEVINCGSGREVSIKELAQIIYKENPAKIKYRQHPNPSAEIKRIYCNNEKARTLLGWQPGTALEEGISKTEEWLRLRL